MYSFNRLAHYQPPTSTLFPYSTLFRSFRGHVEHRCGQARRVAELVARHRANAALVAQEDAIGIEDLNAEVLLEVTKRGEHPIDRTSGALAALVRRDDQKTPFPQLALAANRVAVRRPLIEKRVDLREKNTLFVLIESRRDSEDPDVGVVGELIDVD